jgi:hypothetical protein
MFRSSRVGVLTEVLQSSSVSAHRWTIEDESIMFFRNVGNCLAQRHSVASQEAVNPLLLWWRISACNDGNYEDNVILLTTATSSLKYLHAVVCINRALAAVV